MAAAQMTKSPHVLVIPFPTADHFNPFLDFTYRLSSHGLSITILTTLVDSPSLQRFFSRAQSADLDIRPLYIPLPSGTSTIPNKPSLLLVQASRHLAEPIQQWIQQQNKLGDGGGSSRHVTCIISDFYLGWTQKIALKTKIPRIVFHSYSAFGVCVDNSLWNHLPHLGAKSDDEPFDVPDLPLHLSLRRSQLSQSARLFQKFDPLSEFMRENRLLNLQSWGAIVNTFYDLEMLHINNLHDTTGKLVWALGPILPTLMADEDDENEDFYRVHQWLHSQKAESVLFVNVENGSPEQVSELALALEGLDNPFLWVQNGNEFHHGFQVRVRDRGLVMRACSAAQQFSILSHPSIGGFMTRCGWNSTLASIAAGVPMITWPMDGDQFYNSLVVVNLLEIGVQACEGEKGSREKVKRAVERIMSGGEEKGRARQLGDLARKGEEGSFTRMKAFVDEILEIASTTDI